MESVILASDDSTVSSFPGDVQQSQIPTPSGLSDLFSPPLRSDASSSRLLYSGEFPSSSKSKKVQPNLKTIQTWSTPLLNPRSVETPFTPSQIPQTPSSSQNPQSLICVQTPVISGPIQAKNSIKLQNCVATVNLQCNLNLLDIYCRTRFSEYNPSRFHGVVMKIFEPRATALVFSSGKLVCTGTRSEHDSLLATRKFSRIIQKLGFPVKFGSFKIQNLVATADLRFPIKLESLQQTHGQFTSYEPELFPGLVYRMIRPRIVLLIFVNGKIVFTGAKSREDIADSLNIIYPILRSFKKN